MSKALVDLRAPDLIVKAGANPSRADRRLFKGTPRSYQEAVQLGLIDTRIRQLVAALNVGSLVTTRSSCQGHGCLRMVTPPFVLFQAPQAFASALSLRLEQAASHESGTFSHYWTITGLFDCGQMRYRLSLGEKPRGSWHLVRRRLDADFARLRELVKQEVDHCCGCQQDGFQRPVLSPQERNQR
jgi:hypothetical protein